ncbi:helix-turn-helix domain-containing protein [Loigolactobacillus zhaoyuanensis]|uniref:Helix-turn-helix domain-containing protein n=1 Tax=Loigolactobacillus zhaoyuanensis TaxID=2486017 RepID=A0ABW8UE83_9LACO|nr:AraC family transcriptional regulator [Loigolactobacillus zhaoyuanensis]
MKLAELKTYCQLFYDSYRIPVCCYDSQFQFQSLHPQDIDQNIFNEISTPLFDTKLDVALITDQQFLSWGCIKDKKSGNFLLLGPALSIPLDDQEIRIFMKEHIIPNRSFESIQTAINRIPPMPIQQFLHILKFLNYQINQEEISDKTLLNFLIPDNSTTNFYSQSRFYINSTSSTEIKQSFTSAYQAEQLLLHYIETGNLNKLHQHALRSDLPIPNIGTTPMSQQKMSGIVVITVITRFVIKKGMDIDTALRLSDIYLQGIDCAMNTKELTTLIINAYIDYSKRLQAIKIPATTSPLITNCIQYARQSINTPITVSDVAHFVGKSLSYVSSKFKKELGFTLSTFINRCKIEEAQNLLQNTNMTIAEISNYLCFSDQSYFYRVFRQIIGSTPLQYKRKYNSQ